MTDKARTSPLSESMVRNMAWQWGASIYTALFSAALSILLGRMLGPSDFGIYNYVLMLGSLVFILQGGGYKILIFREETLSGTDFDGIQSKLPGMAAGHLLVATSIAVLIFGLLPNAGAAAAAAVFAFGVQAWVENISAVYKGAGRFDREGLLRAATRTASGIGIGAALAATGSVAWIFVGWGVGSGLLLLPLKSARCRLDFTGWAHPQVRSACLAFMAVEASTLIYWRSDILLMEWLGRDSGEIGQYSAAYRFIEFAVFMAAPLGAVLFRRFRRNFSDLTAFSRSVMWSGAVMAGAGCAAVFCSLLAGRAVVILCFGPEYDTAGALLPVLAAALIFALPCGIFSQAATARNRERFYAAAAAFCALLNVAMNCVFIPRYGAFGAASTTIATEAVLCALLAWGALRGRA